MILARPRVAIAALAVAASATAVAAVPHAAALTPAPHSHTVVGLHHRIQPDTSRSGRTSGAQSDYNWAGYVKTGSGYTSSTATWTVPTLSTKYDGYSSSWVGIDGFNDSYLIQTGTEADVVNGQTSYDAWWEVITPSDEAPEVLFSSLSINPGDSITASVAKGSSGKWTMKLTDNTSGQSASHSSKFSGPGDSAEWIQEDTDVNGYISAAPDWHSVTFSGITVNGASPQLNSSESLDIVDTNGTQETSTGNPNSSGNGFTVTWLATGTPTSDGS